MLRVTGTSIKGYMSKSPHLCPHCLRPLEELSSSAELPIYDYEPEITFCGVASGLGHSVELSVFVDSFRALERRIRELEARLKESK